MPRVPTTAKAMSSSIRVPVTRARPTTTWAVCPPAVHPGRSSLNRALPALPDPLARWGQLVRPAVPAHLDRRVRVAQPVRPVLSGQLGHRAPPVLVERPAHPARQEVLLR